MTVDRRSLVGSVLGGGLILAFRLEAAASDPSAPRASRSPLDSWLQISPDNTVTVHVARAEMGQGVFTAFAMILAEELDADWTKLRVKPAPVELAFSYGGHRIEGTGNSSSVRDTWDILRLIGARARAMLLAAAAKSWSVPASACSIEAGVVSHRESGRSARFGELAAAAARLPPPEKPPMKETAAYKLVGKPTKRLDTALKLAGEPVFGIDVDLPDLQHAAVLQAPVFGSELTNQKQLEKKHPTVRLVRIPGGLAAVASSYWQAQRALDTLAPDVRWTKGPTEKPSSLAISRKLREAAASGGGSVVVARGDAAKRFREASKKIVSEYTTPYLAHATLEPMNCTARLSASGAELWLGTQAPGRLRKAAADFLKLPEEAITLHAQYLGGGFGRRAESDVAIQALTVAQAVGRPVKLVWSREQDMRHDFYRPASVIRLQGGLDESGRLACFTAHLASSSLLARFGSLGANAVDPTTVAGLRDVPYDVPHVQIECSHLDPGVPIGFWRSVGDSHNAFFVECFIDELAALASADPYRFRRDLLHKHPRLVRVLDAVARLSRWESGPPRNRFRGIAVHGSFGSVVAQVFEVSITGGRLAVHKVWVAADCGRIVNPSGVIAQMEGAVVFGLSAALHGEITLEEGRVVQSNFHDYPVLAPAESPEIDVTLVDSDYPPGGAGEPGVPPVAPALVNAVFAATGKRCRSLPLSRYKPLLRV
jgi:isoquinoline 1-oxidoreductase beta subunit